MKFDGMFRVPGDFVIFPSSVIRQNFSHDLTHCSMTRYIEIKLMHHHAHSCSTEKVEGNEYMVFAE